MFASKVVLYVTVCWMKNSGVWKFSSYQALAGITIPSVRGFSHKIQSLLLFDRQLTCCKLTSLMKLNYDGLVLNRNV